MGKFIIVITLAGVCLIISLVLIESLDDSVTKQTYAQAALVAQQGQARLDAAQAAAIQTAVQGQARLDSAQALALIMTAALPWFVLGVLGIGAMIITMALLLIFMTRPIMQEKPAQIVQREILILPAGMPRREVWEMMSRSRANYDQLVDR